jgi:hypothetical protein
MSLKKMETDIENTKDAREIKNYINDKKIMESEDKMEKQLVAQQKHF